MNCLFSICYDNKCEREADVIIKEKNWKYGLCEEHYSQTLERRKNLNA